MKDTVKLIKVKEAIQSDNDQLAGQLRGKLKEEKSFLLT